MSDRPYPDGIDCVWLASDRDGHLAAFVTAGVGPIPIQILSDEGPAIEDIEEHICDMPSVSAVHLLGSIKRPDSFIKLAERGVFVYDWSDIHRIIHESIHAYEPVAVPVSPITIDMLPDDLSNIAKAVKFVDLAFADGQLLDVYVHMNYHEGR